MTHEREITSPVELCLPDGRLNPDAHGWTRRPLHRSHLRGWGRTKRWEYWGITTPAHVIGVVVSSLDYAGVHGLYVADRSTGREWRADATVPLARGTILPDTSGGGDVHATAPGLRIDLTPSTIRARSKTIAIDLTVPPVPDRESLGVVVKWSPSRFQYTVKDVGRPVHGTLTLDGVTHEVPESGSFATLDHGRGRWPYSTTWNWAAGAAPGRAIQLGGKWTDGSGTTENALFLDGRLHKIGEDLAWTYDRTNWTAPWHITGERVNAVFTPFHERVSRANLLVLSGETHQCFGTFSGWATTGDGTRVDLSGLTGWAEESRNRW